MKIDGKYAASNFIVQQGLILDTDKQCYVKSRKLFGLFDISDKCKPLPKLDYVLLFRTLYAKCEECSLEDFETSSLIQLSLVYNKNRKLIVHEGKNMKESFEKARLLAQMYGLKIRDSATDRRKPKWLAVS